MPPTRPGAPSYGKLAAIAVGAATAVVACEALYRTIFEARAAEALEASSGRSPEVTIGSNPTKTEGKTENDAETKQETAKPAQSAIASEVSQTTSDEAAPENSTAGEGPSIFESSKFFSCIGLEDSRQLLQAAETVEAAHGEVLFRQGDESESGVLLVTKGSVGVFLQEEEGAPPCLMNILRAGESVGDVDVLDGAPRSVSCIVMAEGATYVKVSRTVFLRFVAERPRVLHLYLQQAISRLWRVAHFVLNDFLQLPRKDQGAGLSGTCDASPGADIAFVPVSPPSDSEPQGKHQGSKAPAPRLKPSSLTLTRQNVQSYASAPDLAGLQQKQSGSSRSPVGGSSVGFSSTDLRPVLPEDMSTSEAEPLSDAEGHAGSLSGPASGPTTTTGGGEEGAPAPSTIPPETTWAHPSWVRLGYPVSLRQGQTLYTERAPANCFYMLCTGRLLADPVPWPFGDGVASPPIVPGCIVGAAAFLTRTARRETMRATESCTLFMIGMEELEAMMEADAGAFVALMLLTARSLGSLIRRFISLGLNRVWLSAGDTAFSRGDAATSLFIVLSGRIRLFRPPASTIKPIPSVLPLSQKRAAGTTTADWSSATSSAYRRQAKHGFKSSSFRSFAYEEDYGPRAAAAAAQEAGAAEGSPAASDSAGHRASLDSERSYSRGERWSGEEDKEARKTEEVGRGDTVGESSLLSEGVHEDTAICVRDTEMVRMSRESFQLICARRPAAAARLLEVMAKKLRKDSAKGRQRQELTTIALLPGAGVDGTTGGAGVTTLRQVAVEIREALQVHGPTLHLCADGVSLQFADGTMDQLNMRFYRSKLTSWMAQQEEDFRFIILEGHPEHHPQWANICVSQADCVLVVAAARAKAEPSPAERRLLWSRREGAHSELVLIHRNGEEPEGTQLWREQRPYVRRHHHVRAGKPSDMHRLARHLAGRSVGLVLSGGGARGLAHLGVIRALEDAGVPIDVVGGTSQGAFMAALYAVDGGSQSLLSNTRTHAEKVGSVRHLITDLTLPILSIFSGHQFDRLIREPFKHRKIEDLWLRFFCTTSNLRHGEVRVHESGPVWKYVRASMTVLGILPPVQDNGDLLVDGGYLNSLPVDIMRERMGVDTVIVVDVEDKECYVFKALTPFDGGISGWNLLWERINPFSKGENLPRYNQLVETLMSATSSSKAKQISRQYSVDLFIRPPQRSHDSKHLDYQAMDAIVRKSYCHAMSLISSWQRKVGKEGVARPGAEAPMPMHPPSHAAMPPLDTTHTSTTPPSAASPLPPAPAASAAPAAPSPSACMSQLVAKQSFGAAPGALPKDGALVSPSKGGQGAARSPSMRSRHPTRPSSPPPPAPKPQQLEQPRDDVDNLATFSAMYADPLDMI